MLSNDNQTDKNSVALTSTIPLFDNDKLTASFANGRDFEYSTTDQEFTFRKFSPSNILALDPRPAVTELDKIYPKSYLPYQFDSLPAIVVFFRNFVQKLKVRFFKQLLKEDASVLDLGCGNGQLLLLLKNFGSPKWKLFGSDFSDSPKARLEQQGIHFFQGDIREINVSQKFDMIILNQVVEHLPDVKSVLRKLNELLKDDGFLVLETPSSDGLDARLFKDRYWGGYHFPRHFYIFNESNLAMVVEDCGFKVKSTSYMASPSFWIQSLHHYVMEKVSPKLLGFFTAGNIPLLAIFTIFDTAVAFFGGKTSNMRVVAIKKAK